MKALFLLFIFLSFQATAVENQPMLRLWRGFVNYDADETRLKERLNKELLPETIRVGQGKGLTAYLPALFPTDRPSFLPAETALVTYESKEKYEAIRSTPQGKAYGELHFVEGMFAKQTEDGYVSKSEVVVPYEGSVKLPEAAGDAKVEAVAYGIGAYDENWQEAFAFLETLVIKGDVTDKAIVAQTEEYLKQLESFTKQERLKGAVVLVNRKYVLSLLAFKDVVQAKDFTRSSAFSPKGFSIDYGFAQTNDDTLEPKRLLNFSFRP